MRRNRTEVKGDPPRLLAGKRERPIEAEEEKPNKCAESLCKLLRGLFICTIMFGGIFLFASEPKKMEPLQEYPPAVYGSKGPEDHTSEILCRLRKLQPRFTVIANLVDTKDADKETLAQFQDEMDRLRNVIDKTQPGERLSDKHRAILAERFNKFEDKMDAIERELGISV